MARGVRGAASTSILRGPSWYNSGKAIQHGPKLPAEKQPMSYTPQILAFAGSARKDSWNKKLVRIAADGARAAGASVCLIELDVFPLPLFNQDDEAEHGRGENAPQLQD